MPARAFVIAIEDYAAGNFLESLTGVNDAAAVFIRWLIEKKGVKAADIVCCAGKKFSAGPKFKKPTAGTKRAEIVAQLAKVLKDWANKTDEFYFYFSGHGFSYADKPWEKAVDILAASDFKDLATGGAACLRLGEVQSLLWTSMGPYHHYYFIDACRNLIPSDQINPATTGLGFPASDRIRPTVYKLFSTASGSLSHTTSGFTTALVEGLSGGGRAKGLRAKKMYVIFDLLCEYMKKKVEGQEVDFHREGSGEGYILELNPIPKSDCVVNVEGAKPTDEFMLTVEDFKGLGLERKFKGGSFKLPLVPDDYAIRVTHPKAKVVQKEPPPTDYLDLFDPCKLKFEMQTQSKSAAKKSSARRAGGAKGGGGVSRGIGVRPPVGNVPQAVQPKPASLKVKAASASDTGIEVRSLTTGEVIKGAKSLEALLPPGDYEVKLRERGVTVERRRLTLKAGRSEEVDLLARPVGRVRETIIKAVKAIELPGATVFSEQYLGPMVNQELNLWLSIFGASRIVGAPGQHAKLEKLPLESFKDMKRDETAVYVLAGFEKTEGPFSVGLSEGAQVDWETLGAVKGLERIYERRLQPGQAGARLLSLKIPGQPALTFATYCLPNRVTLFVLAENEDGRLQVRQFILPVNHLIPHLDPMVRSYLRPNMLGLVRTMCLAQEQFARKRSVEEQLKATDESVWLELIHHKWLDPLLSLVAAYDVIRHGSIKQVKGLLQIMSSNLRHYFGGIPDIEAIAKLIGANWSIPRAAPLLFDGVLAFNDVQEKQMLPLPPEKLDYASVWTTWRGAVNEPASARTRGGTRLQKNLR